MLSWPSNFIPFIFFKEIRLMASWSFFPLFNTLRSVFEGSFLCILHLGWECWVWRCIMTEGKKNLKCLCKWCGICFQEGPFLSSGRISGCTSKSLKLQQVVLETLDSDRCLWLISTFYIWNTDMETFWYIWAPIFNLDFPTWVIFMTRTRCLVLKISVRNKWQFTLIRKKSWHQELE